MELDDYDPFECTQAENKRLGADSAVILLDCGSDYYQIQAIVHRESGSQLYRTRRDAEIIYDEINTERDAVSFIVTATERPRDTGEVELSRWQAFRDRKARAKPRRPT